MEATAGFLLLVPIDIGTALSGTFGFPNNSPQNVRGHTPLPSPVQIPPKLKSPA